MRFIYIVFFAMASFLTMPTDAESFSISDITFSSKEMARGDVILLSIKTGREETPKVTWMQKEIALVYNDTSAVWQGFLAADLNQKKGTYKVLVRIASSGFEKTFNIQVIHKDYGVRTLTLPKEKVELDAESLKRVKAEAAAVNALWSAQEPLPAWKGIFLMPVEGEVVGTFGKRSVINSMERSPHTGVDQKGDAGTPVMAINNGRIVLIADHFFTGNTLFLDHGGGIISMYFHLDKVLVNDGDIINKGQTIGLVGATGRVTGPHLHWGVRVNGARVNPLTLVDLSRVLEE
jgi:murein DD-endopeptidase MepM/ murein hydrolase activator NlpD